jgi:N-acetylmuramoyl-L-alanine amidase
MKGLSFLIATWLVLAASLAEGRTIIIDAGHGGHDRGGIPGQRISEKVLALDVATRLEKRLRKAGFRTVMTRKRDVFVPLGTRVAIANRYRDGVFVSVHFNSAEREGARGFETYYAGGSASYRLAAEIQRNLLRTTRTENRGVKRRGFYVLRKTRIPAVLVECGFLTNRQEGRLSLSSRHRERLAAAIASAIIKRY